MDGKFVIDASSNALTFFGYLDVFGEVTTLFLLELISGIAYGDINLLSLVVFEFAAFGLFNIGSCV